MLMRRFIRLAFRLFYNQFAFTYDTVSAIVSRGRWRDWTRAAIPRVVGTRVLEVPCGTGNLLLDLRAAGYAPIGVDLSPNMLRIARGKLRHARVRARHSPVLDSLAHQGWNRPSKISVDQGVANALPLLCRARAEQLPFPRGAFDSIVMTFPANFIFDPRTFAEFHRVLADDGRVIWVDVPQLFPQTWWSRFLGWALGAVASGVDYRQLIQQVLERAGFEARTESVEDGASVVWVTVADKVLLTT